MTQPNYSQLAAASAKKPIPTTPKIVPTTPVVNSTSGSALAAASVKAPLTNTQAKQVIQASQPPPPPTTTGYVGVSNTVTGAQGSMLAAQAAQNGPLTQNQVKELLTNGPPQVYPEVKPDRDPTASEIFREGERNPVIPETTGNLPNSYDLFGVNDSGVEGVWSNPWNEKRGDRAEDYKFGQDIWSDSGSDTQKTETDRWKMLAEQYGEQKKRDMTDNKNGPLNDARGDPIVHRTPEQLQVTDAARYTGQAIMFGQWPNIITTRVADELNWRGQGYNSAEEWLADMGYMYDEAGGLWVRGDVGAPQTVNTEGYTEEVYEDAYSYDWGDYGWGDSGYGYGGYDYGSGGGGNNYGSGGGLIQWRIG